MTTITKVATIQDAVRVADFFSSLKAVQAVYLFGGCSIRDKGNDLDLILQVDPKSGEEFIRYLENFRSQDIYQEKASKGERYVEACRILGLRSDLLSWLIDSPEVLLDLFLFPDNWHKNDRIAQALYTRDRGGLHGFIDRIWKESRRYDPFRYSFMNK